MSHWDDEYYETNEYYRRRDELHRRDEENEMEKARQLASIHDGSEPGCGCFFVIVIILAVLAGIVNVINDGAAKLADNAGPYSEAAIAEAETIEFGKEYKDKTIKNAKDHYNFKAYKFTVDEAGTVTIDYKCKRAWLTKAHMVKWELIDLKTGETILKSPNHTVTTAETEIEPGDYAIQFHSRSNELNRDWFRRKYTFTVSFTAGEIAETTTATESETDG